MEPDAEDTEANGFTVDESMGEAYDDAEYENPFEEGLQRMLFGTPAEHKSADDEAGPEAGGEGGSKRKRLKASTQKRPAAVKAKSPTNLCMGCLGLPCTLATDGRPDEPARVHSGHDCCVFCDCDYALELEKAQGGARITVAVSKLMQTNPEQVNHALALLEACLGKTKRDYYEGRANRAVSRKEQRDNREEEQDPDEDWEQALQQRVSVAPRPSKKVLWLYLGVAL